MKRLTYAIVAAGALLAAGTTRASTGGGSPPPTLDCTQAVASLGVIWPPNHTFVPVMIWGVTTDPSLGSVSINININIDAIHQDEPVDALGSGNTAPDGKGVGTNTAYVRAERSGPGTGRLYSIDFTATDGMGYTCSGVVQVQVPHDQGQGFIPIDTGQWYDSTQIPP